MVSPDTIRTVVGVLGNFIALGVFLSPLPTFLRIRKKKSVEEFSAMPYLAALMNCMFWLSYGIPAVHRHSTLVLTINGAGFAIELAYVAVFLMYSNGKKRSYALVILLCEFASVGVMLSLVLSLAHSHARRSLVIGILCVVFGTGMYASPLSVMKMVIETKSVEYMPLSLSIMCFFNGFCWTVYALIRFDRYIVIPNVLGVIFSTIQLILYGVYFKSTQEQIEARNTSAAENINTVV